MLKFTVSPLNDKDPLLPKVSKLLIITLPVPLAFKYKSLSSTVVSIVVPEIETSPISALLVFN